MTLHRLSLTLTLAVFGLLAQPSKAELSQELEQTQRPTPPISANLAGYGTIDETLVIAGGFEAGGRPSSRVYSLAEEAEQWIEIGQLEQAWSDGASVVHSGRLILIGGKSDGKPTANVLGISLVNGSGITTESLPKLPSPLVNAAATLNGDTLFVAGGSSDGTDSSATSYFLSLNLKDIQAGWSERATWDGPALHSAELVKSVETLTLIGGVLSDGSPAQSTHSFHPRYGWSKDTSTSPSGFVTDAGKLGDAHAIVTIRDAASTKVTAYAYHLIGQTWLLLGGEFDSLPADTQIFPAGNEFTFLSQSRVTYITLGDPETNYSWIDNVSIALYFLVVIWVGFRFSNKSSSSSQDYFRGGNRIPWWAAGMSLFATGASAMSLMAMPGKSYASNWTFFAISIYSVIALPLSMYLLAPLIRKLNFGTAFEYLEHRFGLFVRILGSVIFAVYQILGRMGSVLLLPSFALEAIAGIPMQVSVPLMGIVTIAYTYLGGLAAVIWTDTIQGFVMILAVLGCLILVFAKIEMPMAEIWTTLEAQDKLHTFDWGFSLTQENVFTVFLGIVAITLLGIGDQNYVQRVQCSSSLKDTKKAIATQMGVAIPINILLFALGTALFIFYKQAPADLNPVMKNDGIFPFFAAQHLPIGASGLVIAALLAATMSTISSSICSVSNLAVDDFYKRFSKNPSDKKAVSVGRVITLLVGLFGIASAFYINSFDTPSIWDIFLKVVSIITATTLGTFALGLLTKSANQAGSIAGIVLGMLATFYISRNDIVIFWLYPIVGSIVTFITGYIISLASGGNKKDIEGLTIATLQSRKGGLDD